MRLLSFNLIFLLVMACSQTTTEQIKGGNGSGGGVVGDGTWGGKPVDEFYDKFPPKNWINDQGKRVYKYLMSEYTESADKKIISADLALKKNKDQKYQYLLRVSWYKRETSEFTLIDEYNFTGEAKKEGIKLILPKHGFVNPSTDPTDSKKEYVQIHFDKDFKYSEFQNKQFNLEYEETPRPIL